MVRGSMMSLRLPVRLLRWLNEQAAKEDVSRSKLVVRILDQHRQSEEATRRYFNLPQN